jgi:small conductance mechanosensitive channel
VLGAQAVTDPDLVRACGGSPGFLCRQVFEATGNRGLAGTVDVLVDVPLKVLLILVVAWVLGAIARRAIRRTTDRLVATATGGRLRRLRDRSALAMEDEPRAVARAETLGTVLRSVASATIYGLALIEVLGVLGIDLGPLVASAGIAGVAVGFGAQTLVKDFLTGLFMLVEDQYGVGDIVDLGPASGVVEAVGLRTTRLRDVEGVVWHVPNGQVVRVANKSQDWSRALLDLRVGLATDIRRLEALIREVAEGMRADEAWADRITGEPEVWGLESLAPDGVTIRLAMRTRPAQQFAVLRELRLRLKEAMEQAGIEAPSATSTIKVQTMTTPGATSPPL